MGQYHCDKMKVSRPLREFRVDRSPETTLRGIPIGVITGTEAKESNNGHSKDNGIQRENTEQWTPAAQTETGSSERTGTGTGTGTGTIGAVSTGLLRKALCDALGPNIMQYQEPFFKE